MPERRGQHGARFSMVHGHARFAEYVLAGLKRSDGHRRMHIWPCAYADSIYARVFKKRLPMVMNLRNGKLIGDPLARLPCPVGDSDDLYAVLLCETRNMKGSGVAAGSDQADADLFFGHETAHFSVSGAY